MSLVILVFLKEKRGQANTVKKGTGKKGDRLLFSKKVACPLFYYPFFILLSPFLPDKAVKPLALAMGI